MNKHTRANTVEKRRPPCGRHLLNVKMRAVTARRKRHRLLAKLSALTLGVTLACGFAWFGLAKALDKLFFDNQAYNLSNLTLELDGVMTPKDLLAETGIHIGQNIFRIDLAETDRRLRELPMVADVVIERLMPDGIDITLTARDPVAWVSSSSDASAPYTPTEMLLVDDSGFLMKPRLLQPEFHQLPIIYGVKVAEIKEGSILHNDDLWQALSLLREARNQAGSLLVIRSLNLAKGYCIDALTDQQACVKFASGDFETQLAKMQRLLQHCRDTGRELESVNLIVRKNTPVKFVMASLPPPPVLNSKTSTQKSKSKKN